MLTAKQEALTRFIAAHIGVAGVTPQADTLVRLKELAEEVADFGVDEDFVSGGLSALSTLSELDLGVRAQGSLVAVAREKKLADSWEDARDLQVQQIAGYLSEEGLAGMKNTGTTTIREIKRMFGMCGIAIPMRL